MKGHPSSRPLRYPIYSYHPTPRSPYHLIPPRTYSLIGNHMKGGTLSTRTPHRLVSIPQEALSALLKASDEVPGGRAWIETLAPVETATLAVLRLARPHREGAGGGGGSQGSTSACASVGKGAWAGCRSVVDAVLERMRSQWNGLHPLSELARCGTCTCSALPNIVVLYPTIYLACPLS